MSVVPETPVGYVVANDVYVSYSEYYGDGTIYGYTELLTPDGNPVKGAGKSKADLINENAVLGNNLGSVNGDIIAVEMPVVPVPAEVPEVAPEAAEVVPEVPEAAEVLPEVPEAAEVVPEVPEAVPEAAEVVPEVPEAAEVPDRYTVSFCFMGFNITREFTAKIDVEGRRIYLEV
jgi:hypothetical protein